MCKSKYICYLDENWSCFAYLSCILNVLLFKYQSCTDKKLPVFINCHRYFIIPNIIISVSAKYLIKINFIHHQKVERCIGVLISPSIVCTTHGIQDELLNGHPESVRLRSIACFCDRATLPPVWVGHIRTNCSCSCPICSWESWYGYNLSRVSSYLNILKVPPLICITPCPKSDRI